MKKIVLLWVLSLGMFPAAASDPSEEGVPTSPVTAYSGGVAGGAFFVVSEKYSNEPEQYLKLAFINSIYPHEVRI